MVSFGSTSGDVQLTTEQYRELLTTNFKDSHHIIVSIVRIGAQRSAERLSSLHPSTLRSVDRPQEVLEDPIGHALTLLAGIFIR